MFNRQQPDFGYLSWVVSPLEAPQFGSPHEVEKRREQGKTDFDEDRATFQKVICPIK
jgi:hypothetical protein